MTIPLQFGLFWSERKMSFLRYLTFVSLRKFHPNSEIQLYMPKKYENNPVKWTGETQDFLNKDINTNYFDRLDDLSVKIIETDKFDKYLPNFQSDFFRWWWLNEFGGFYLDTDQIILKSFNSINLNYDLIWTKYKISGNRDYYPVGVLGARKNTDILKYINEMIAKYYNRDDYNSIGPFFMQSIMQAKGGNWWNRTLNTDRKSFYPIGESCDVDQLYNGSFNINETDSYAVHWFGGHPKSQEFNAIYNESKLKENKDSISILINKLGIL